MEKKPSPKLITKNTLRKVWEDWWEFLQRNKGYPKKPTNHSNRNWFHQEQPFS